MHFLRAWVPCRGSGITAVLVGDGVERAKGFTRVVGRRAYRQERVERMGGRSGVSILLLNRSMRFL